MEDWAETIRTMSEGLHKNTLYTYIDAPQLFVFWRFPDIYTQVAWFYRSRHLYSEFFEVYKQTIDFGGHKGEHSTKS